jgi:threonine dehydrogenase-like Zn-dependent dehydrogenase
MMSPQTLASKNDVVIKVTGSTICGSDLHLFHGEIMPLQKGDILGHEVRSLILTNWPLLERERA